MYNPKIPPASPIKVKYKVLPAFRKTLWPILDLQLSYRGRMFPYKILALVDSGASNSIIRTDIAEALGVDLREGKKIRGASVSGNYESVELSKRIDVDIWGHKFDFKFFALKNMVWDCILGEDSIFEIARIDFQKFKGYFEIRFRQDIN